MTRVYAGISKAAFDLIVKEEVSSEAVYRKRYTHTEWPGFSSGVTIGIGYDVGYATKERLWKDWSGLIPDDMIKALERCCGVRGTSAKGLAAALRKQVTVPWEAAIENFEKVLLPRWVKTVRDKLPNTHLLSPDSLGALASLAYNRGPSFRNSGDRYREMRAIYAHMAAKNFAAIPYEFKSMARLWPGSGLVSRRHREAELFRRGLAMRPVPKPEPSAPKPEPEPSPKPEPLPSPKPDVIEDKEDPQVSKPAGRSSIIITSIIGFLVSIWQTIEGYATNPYFWAFMVTAAIFLYIGYKRFSPQMNIKGLLPWHS